MNNRNAIAVIILLVLVVGSVVWYGLSREDATEEQAQVELSVAAFNQTKTADASIVTASPSDIIEFTLVASNPGDEVVENQVVEVSIADLSVGATLIDAGGASYNSATDSLVWEATDVPARESIQKRFTMRVGSSNLSSLRIGYGNEVSIALANPTVAGISPTAVNPTPVYEAPPSGPAGVVTLSLAMAATMVAFMIRRKKTA